MRQPGDDREAEPDFHSGGIMPHGGVDGPLDLLPRERDDLVEVPAQLARAESVQRHRPDAGSPARSGRWRNRPRVPAGAPRRRGPGCAPRRGSAPWRSTAAGCSCRCRCARSPRPCPPGWTSKLRSRSGQNWVGRTVARPVDEEFPQPQLPPPVADEADAEPLGADDRLRHYSSFSTAGSSRRKTHQPSSQGAGTAQHGDQPAAGRRGTRPGTRSSGAAGRCRPAG